MDSKAPQPETYISVDVETAGPEPETYSLLSIGACLVVEPQHQFYVELQPVNQKGLPRALAISKLSLEHLAQEGQPPVAAMQAFADWLARVTPSAQRPIFVAFNAGFDWMFVNTYFHRYLGYNPFGHASLDIKSYYMGLASVRWDETSMKQVGPRYLGKDSLAHNALQDALDQAVIFRKMLAQARKESA
jgi:ribonuclease T